MGNHKRAIQTLQVKTKLEQYPIYISQEGFYSESLTSLFSLGRKVFVVTDKTVEALYLTDFLQQNGLDNCPVFSFEPGESSKSFETWRDILSKMCQEKLNRDAVVIALGGGVVGDMAGFAASCFQRGIPFIQVPTTLLAQVDSSVGGKTAINFNNEKNVIGAFYQPKSVWINTKTLTTLSEREYLAGMAEVIKYGLILDAVFFDWIEERASDILKKEPSVLEAMIHRCCELKADIVQQDEKEQGRRALLNLGHTFAHAIEAATHYSSYLHGEAVAIGLYCQAILATKLNLLSVEKVARIKSLLQRFNLPIHLTPQIDIDEILRFMWRDKKVLDAKMRFILTTDIGLSDIFEISDQRLIGEVLANVIE